MANEVHQWETGMWVEGRDGKDVEGFVLGKRN